MLDVKLAPSLEVKAQTEAFTDQLTIALDHFDDPAWLGENSPLAAPYFLGQYLTRQRDLKNFDDPKRRGEVLRQALREALETMASKSEGQNSYYYKLIWLSFFDLAHPSPEVIWTGFSASKAKYYRDRKQAVKQLEEFLLGLLKPTLRPERPRFQPHLIGRSQVIATCTRALQQGQTVGLSGLGGIGKTALGAYLSAQVAPDSTFWFTLRLGLNDHLSSLLFALGYFLHNQGSSSLWGQLVAGGELIDPEMALSLTRHDLKQISKNKPLLCFDEVDLLRPAEIEAHTQILTFLEGLRGQAPLLFIGQHLLLEPEVLHILEGLNRTDIETMLQRDNLKLSSDSLTRLQEFTRGNPRLIELFMALLHAGDSLTGMITEQTGVPTLDFLLNRIWERLGEPEQELLTELAAFRRPAPGDAWPQIVLNQLVNRHLVQADSQGGVMLLPAFKEIIYQKLPAENQQAIHLKAATVRVSRGENTPAAYHYVKGGYPRLAIWLWYAYQTQEINQGQAETALLLFQEISLNQLKGADQEALDYLRGRLSMLLGDYPRARQSLRRIFWQSPILKAQTKRLEGDIAELVSEFERANRAYQEGLTAVENLWSESAQFYKNLGWVAMRRRDLDQAWRYAQLARYEAENLQGYIEEERGHYNEAESYYRSALTLAESLHHTHGEAKTANNLANVLARQGRFTETEALWRRACQLFESIGYLTKLAGARVNQAFGYNLAGHYEAAIPPAQEALALFERLGEAYGQAVAAQNLAEAYLAWGKLAEAEHYARRVIDTEETDTLSDGLRVLGEIKLAQQQVHEAEQLIRQAIEVAQQKQDKYLEAYAWRALGWVHLAQQKQAEAKAAFQKAIELFEELGLPDEVERTRREVGEVVDNKDL